jgi:hypothetical protein
MSANDVYPLAQDALDAFWQVIASRFLEATAGELSPERTIWLQLAA